MTHDGETSIRMHDLTEDGEIAGGTRAWHEPAPLHASDHDSARERRDGAWGAPSDRRGFLVRASLLGVAASGALAGCDPPPVPNGASAAAAPRAGGGSNSLAGPLLDAVGDAVLPESLGQAGRASAVAAFAAWAAGFEPVAQEMLGYGYADVRYLPADPAPGWRAQLEALELLALKRGTSFAALDITARRAVLSRALPARAGNTLPAPLDAPHVALALLSHWASGSDAWDLALGARVQRERCRSLATTTATPSPLETT